MAITLINIGFGNIVSANRLVAIVSPESAPIKRIIQDARDRGVLVDATCGRRTVFYALLTFYFGVTLFLPRTVTILVHGGYESLGAPTFSELLFVIISAAVAVLAAHAVCFGQATAAEDEEVTEVVEEVQE